MLTLMRAAARACVAAALVAAAAAQAAAPFRLEATLERLGYAVKSDESAGPSGWESEQFNLLSKRVMRLKSVRQVPDWRAAFYRFTVVEERYADGVRAARRLGRIREEPPGLSPEDDKAFPLRRGFRFREFVYVVSTDVSSFKPELTRLTRELERARRTASRK
ncbi:MAG TPA: hypothetical protein VM936_02470 [Pyrinomonadaceae bacterium]|jgi:hypothetical protein|nr:hypothetical protein [Pyrinomonadaceae bacterium]